MRGEQRAESRRRRWGLLPGPQVLGFHLWLQSQRRLPTPPGLLLRGRSLLPPLQGTVPVGQQLSQVPLMSSTAASFLLEKELYGSRKWTQSFRAEGQGRVIEISGRLTQCTDWSLQVRQGNSVQDISMPQRKDLSRSTPRLPGEVASIAQGPHEVLLTRAVWGTAAMLNGP